jgi:hypothetical protein
MIQEAARLQSDAWLAWSQTRTFQNTCAEDSSAFPA